MQIWYKYDTTWGRILNINFLKMNNWKSRNFKQFIASKKCQSARRFVHWFINQPRYQINFYCIFLMISFSNNFPLYIFCECLFLLGIENLEMPGNSLDFLQILLNYKDQLTTWRANNISPKFLSKVFLCYVFLIDSCIWCIARECF